MNMHAVKLSAWTSILKSRNDVAEHDGEDVPLGKDPLAVTIE
jgi:hypothetical protein